MKVLNEENIKTVLSNSGLTEKEAEVYILLAKHEALKATETAKLLNKDKAQVFRILKSLQNKGFAESTFEFPARFTAMPFEKVIDSIVKAKREEVTYIEQTKTDFLNYLNRKRREELPSLEKFVVIKGKKKIYSKITQLILNTENQLSVVATITDLTLANHFGVFDAASSHPFRAEIQYRFLTDLSEQNLTVMKKLLQKIPEIRLDFKARNPELGVNMFPRMLSIDNKEILLFTTPKNSRTKRDDICLWTNCRALVETFTAVFEDLWQNSTDINEKIKEIETGKQKPKTCILNDKEVAKRKYDQTLQSAKREVIILTSSNGLKKYSESIPSFKKWAEKGVSVRVMAPIIGENLKVAEKLSKICEVKHVPTKYIESTIVDEKHFFQFKPASPNPGISPQFKNTFYTDDADYVEKMRNMLNDIWRNAQHVSAVTLDEILKKSRTPFTQPSELRPSYFDKVSGLRFEKRKQQRTVTEKDILNKIIDSKFRKEIPPENPMRLHGTLGSAIIHSPPNFNLPEMMFGIFHIEKHSTFGEEDAMLVYLWLDTPKGQAYVPVVFVGDNPKAQSIWKIMMAGTPAGQNIQLVKKDEIQVRIHGNTLFAGWTKQIPLLPPKHILPPACLLIEGYGNLKTDSYTMFFPSGHRAETERNGFDAFVTFFHPSSKYSGPGTDGFFARDYIATTYPPSSSKNNLN